MRHILSLFSLASALASLAQADCSQTSTGFIPINDLGTGTYMGMMGGLYPGGSNVRPAAHQNAGLSFAAQVQPLDGAGTPDPTNGKVVWLSIGFSNTTQEAQAFIPLAHALPDLNPSLVLVDGAVGGQTAAILSTPADPGYAPYWNTVSTRLSNASVTAAQVQAIWLKDDNMAGTTPIEEHADSLLVQFKRITHELYARFPNAHLCYVASRIYAGYASSTLNPEPYAYRNGWTMKQLIADQIAGDAALAYDGPNANSPWLSWGVYLWADGTTPRSDGLTWICPDDYQDDGTHPSDIGRAKVAGMLLDFFMTDSTACSWFVTDCQLATGIRAQAAPSLSISPNPAAGTITITTGLAGRAHVTIYDAVGGTLLSTIVNGDLVPIDVQGFAPGICHVVVDGSDGRRTGTIVIAPN